MKSIRWFAISAIVVVGGVFAYQAVPQSVENDLFLDNVEALAQDEEVIYDERIKEACDCWAKNDKGENEFYGMRIKECERYIWSPPMIKQNCSITSCQKGDC